jgi:hypothetical protein
MTDTAEVISIIYVRCSSLDHNRLSAAIYFYIDQTISHPARVFPFRATWPYGFRLVVALCLTRGFSSGLSSALPGQSFPELEKLFDKSFDLKPLKVNG